MILNNRFRFATTFSTYDYSYLYKGKTYLSAVSTSLYVSELYIFYGRVIVVFFADI